MVIIPLNDLPPRVRRQLERLRSGETASIMQGNAQVAEVTLTTTPDAFLRPIGLCEGQFTVPDSFFDPLPDDLQAAFEKGRTKRSKYNEF